MVQTDDHILRWDGYGATIGWFQDVIRRQHQQTCFSLSFGTQWQVNCHLVTVEVRVERGTNERVQLNGFTFDQLWFERLNAQAVQSWRTVEQYRVFGNDFFQHVPDLWAGTFDHAFGRFDVLRMVEIHQAF